MEQPTTAGPATNPASGEASASSEATTIENIHQLLRTKDDTKRFVGLALLKSVLDNSPRLRQDQQVVQALWASISARFLDRLLKTGSKPSSSNQTSKDMLDLVVSVLHTFVALLPEESRGDAKLTGRIPGLVNALLYRYGPWLPVLDMLSDPFVLSYDETTILIVQVLHSVASTKNGAHAVVQVEDLSPLTETAPAHPEAMDVLRFAWLNSMTVVDDKRALSAKINEAIQSLVSSFTGTDAVTLLEFLGAFLRQADATILPSDPKWLTTVTTFIKKLVTSRPAPQARSAYTNASAALLQAYPSSAPKLLFTDDKKDETPFAYLLINLMLIDIRSSAPTLLEKLNTPEYPQTSRRLASAFDVICIFIGHLVQSLEDDSLETFIMSPDSLLKLRKGISETMSVAIEYLRDRWDASVAGAMGLHPDARASTAATSTGTHYTLAWDSVADTADDDPFILSAVRALSLWLREDENDQLRKEATGLIDMFMDLYRASNETDKLDFRSPVLVALEGLVTLERGREILLRHDGWQILTKDLTSILQGSPRGETHHLGLADVSRGTEIVRILLQVAEQETGGTEEAWMDFITTVASWDASSSASAWQDEQHQLQVAVLQLCCTLLADASEGMRARYRHSIGAINGIAAQVSDNIGSESHFQEEMEDVLETLRRVDRPG
ncbi:ATPases NBP35 [Purpureocillium lavendulum]|uniref:ATPases NBP35 n=1 Tax=Purpureocillium lavendulum TaxID=1247861 RepID=A0AB34FZW3_9HYPO|nr:ATPases NBP35 [Purpureocillium lavendulum]